MIRKYIYYALSALLLAGCNEETLVEEQTNALHNLPEFKITMEGQSRVGVDPNTADAETVNMIWKENDKLRVALASGVDAVYKLHEGENSTCGYFMAETAGECESSQYSPDFNCIIYPEADSSFYYDAASSTTKAYATIPPVQYYVKDSFDPEAFPMFATSVSNTLSFKNLGSVLRIQLKGSEKVKKIQLRGKNDEGVAGRGMCEIANNSKIITDFKIIEPSEDGAKDFSLTITLDCGEGVQLTETPQSFYIVLPCMNFKTGFTLEIYDVNGESMKVNTPEVTFHRNQIKDSSLLTYTNDFTPRKTQAELIDGYDFNDCSMHLPSLDIKDITKITFKTNYYEPDGIKVSSDTSEYTAYINRVKDTNEMVVYTMADEFKLSQNSSYFFKHCESLTEIEGFELCNTEQVTQMKDFFSYCLNLTTLNFSNFNTANVTNMVGMFSCSYLPNNAEFIKHLDTRNVTDMSWMFDACRLVDTLDLSTFNFDKVMYMKSIFKSLGCDTDGAALTLPESLSMSTQNGEYMFEMAFLKSVKCTESFRDWVKSFRFYSSWVDCIRTRDFKWYDVTKPGDVEMEYTVAKLLPGSDKGILSGTTVTFVPNYTAAIPADSRKVSVDGSPEEAYYIANEGLVVSMADEFILNEDSREMFLDKINFTKVDLTGCSSIKVTDMTSMFKSLGSSVADGAELVLDKKIDLFMASIQPVTVTDMFTGVRLKSITCTLAMKQWIRLNAAKNGWDQRDKSITTKWINVTTGEEMKDLI